MNIIQWLLQVWPRRAEEVSRQYRAALEQCPLVFADLRDLAYADRTTMVAGDAIMTAHNEGMRAVWLHIQDHFGIDPNRLHDLLNEMRDEE